MKWLLWREYRLNRPILIAGTALLLAPQVIAAIILWRRPPIPASSDFPYSIFGGAAIYSIILSQLTVLLLGGNAIAGERADRSAEYMAYLPVSRRRRLASKLSLVLSAVVGIWVYNLLILAVFWRPAWQCEVSEMLGCTAITGLAFFGVGWIISSLQSSPTYAVGGALITPLLVFLSLHTIGWQSGLRSRDFDRFVALGYDAICLSLGVVCFAIGTWYYLRRIEP